MSYNENTNKLVGSAEIVGYVGEMDRNEMKMEERMVEMDASVEGASQERISCTRTTHECVVVKGVPSCEDFGGLKGMFAWATEFITPVVRDEVTKTNKRRKRTGDDVSANCVERETQCEKLIDDVLMRFGITDRRQLAIERVLDATPADVSKCIDDMLAEVDSDVEPQCASLRRRLRAFMRESISDSIIGADNEPGILTEYYEAVVTRMSEDLSRNKLLGANARIKCRVYAGVALAFIEVLWLAANLRAQTLTAHIMLASLFVNTHDVVRALTTTQRTLAFSSLVFFFQVCKKADDKEAECDHVEAQAGDMLMGESAKKLEKLPQMERITSIAKLFTGRTGWKSISESVITAGKISGAVLATVKLIQFAFDGVQSLYSDPGADELSMTNAVERIITTMAENGNTLLTPRDFIELRDYELRLRARTLLPHCPTTIVNLYERVKALLATTTAMAIATQQIPEPYVIYMFGEAGVGKTSKQMLLAAVAYEELTGNPLEANMVYACNPVANFQNGYFGQQVFTFDDINYEVSDVPVFVKFFESLVNTTRPLLNTAALHMKDCSYADPKVVMVCANQPTFPHLSNQPVDVQNAINRRIAIRLRVTNEGPFHEDGSHLRYTFSGPTGDALIGFQPLTLLELMAYIRMHTRLRKDNASHTARFNNDLLRALRTEGSYVRFVNRAVGEIPDVLADQKLPPFTVPGRLQPMLAVQNNGENAGALGRGNRGVRRDMRRMFQPGHVEVQMDDEDDAESSGLQIDAEETNIVQAAQRFHSNRNPVQVHVGDARWAHREMIASCQVGGDGFVYVVPFNMSRSEPSYEDAESLVRMLTDWIGFGKRVLGDSARRITETDVQTMLDVYKSSDPVYAMKNVIRKQPHSLSALIFVEYLFDTKRRPRFPLLTRAASLRADSLDKWSASRRQLRNIAISVGIVCGAIVGGVMLLAVGMSEGEDDVAAQSANARTLHKRQRTFRKGAVELPTARSAVVFQSGDGHDDQIHPFTTKQVSSIVRSYIEMRFASANKETTFQIIGVVVDDGMVLMPYHYSRKIRQFVDGAITIRTDGTMQELDWATICDDVYYCDDVSADLSVVWFPTPHVDKTNWKMQTKFASETELNHDVMDAILLAKETDYVVTAHRRSNVSYLSDDADPSSQITVVRYWAYHVGEGSTKGNCGTLLFSSASQRVIGIHTSGWTTQPVGQASLVSSEMIAMMCDKKSFVRPITANLPELEVALLDPDIGIPTMATELHVSNPLPAGKSRLVQNVSFSREELLRAIPTCREKRPTSLTWHQVGEHWYHPLLENLRSVCKEEMTPKLGLQDADMQLLLSECARVYGKHLSNFCAEPRALTWNETILGIPGTSFRALDPRKSCGITGTTKHIKGDFWTIVDGNVVFEPGFHNKLNDAVEKLESGGTLEASIPWQQRVYRLCLKDEKRIVVDGNVKRARLFYVSPLMMIVLARRYMGWAHLVATSNPVETMLGLSISPTSPTWSELGEHYERHGVFGLDYEKFDMTAGALNRWVHETWKQVLIEKGMAACDARLLSEFFREEEVLAAVGTRVMRFRQVIPSGRFGTTLCGGTTHVLAVMCSLCRAKNIEPSVAIRMMLEGKYVTWSDDGIGSLPLYDEHQIDLFTRTLQSLGLKPTSPSKDGPPRQLKFEEASFVSRSFDKTVLNGVTVYLPKLKPESLDVWTYRWKDLTENQHVAVVTAVFLNEIAMYNDQALFARARSFVATVCSRNSVDVNKLFVYSQGMHDRQAKLITNNCLLLEGFGADEEFAHDWRAVGASAWPMAVSEYKKDSVGALVVPQMKTTRVTPPGATARANRERVADAEERARYGVEEPRALSGFAKSAITLIKGADRFVEAIGSMLGWSKPIFTPQPGVPLSVVQSFVPNVMSQAWPINTFTVQARANMLFGPYNTDVQSLGSRWSLVSTGIAWDSTAVARQRLVTFPVNVAGIPGTTSNPDITSTVITQTNQTLAVLPFRFHKYLFFEYEFTVIAPPLVSGRLLITYTSDTTLTNVDPFDAATSSVLTHTSTMDLSVARKMIIRVPYCKNREWLTTGITTVPYCDLSASLSTAEIEKYFDRVANGAIGVYVQQPLLTPTAVAANAKILIQQRVMGLEVYRASNLWTAAMTYSLYGKVAAQMDNQVAEFGKKTDERVVLFCPSALPALTGDNLVDPVRLSRTVLVADGLVPLTTTTFLNITLPSAIVNNASMRSVLSYAAQLRADVELRIQLTASPMTTGCIIAGVIPFDVGDTPDPYGLSLYASELISMGGVTEHVFVVPYFGVHRSYPLSGIQASALSRERGMASFHFQMRTVVPPYSVSGTVPNVRFAVYARLVNTQVRVPTHEVVAQMESELLDDKVQTGEVSAVGETIDAYSYSAPERVCNLMDLMRTIVIHSHSATAATSGTIPVGYYELQNVTKIPYLPHAIDENGVSQSPTYDYIRESYMLGRGSMSVNVINRVTGVYKLPGSGGVGTCMFASQSNEVDTEGYFNKITSNATLTAAVSRRGTLDGSIFIPVEPNNVDSAVTFKLVPNLPIPYVFVPTFTNDNYPKSTLPRVDVMTVFNNSVPLTAPITVSANAAFGWSNTRPIILGLEDDFEFAVVRPLYGVTITASLFMSRAALIIAQKW